MIENRMVNDKHWPLGEQQVSDAEVVDLAVSEIGGWAFNNGDGCPRIKNNLLQDAYIEILESIDQGELFEVLYLSAYEGHIWTGCEISTLIEKYTEHYAKNHVSAMRKIFNQEIKDYIAERDE